jgi:hypothetical protein
MSFLSRLRIPTFVTASTLNNFAFGVQAELKMSEASIAAHRLQTLHVQGAAESIAAARDGQALNPPSHQFSWSANRR